MFSARAKRRVRLPVLAVCLPLAVFARAPAAEDIIELDEMVVTGRAIAEVLSANTLDAAGLSANQARSSDAASLFKDIPGVSLGTGGGVSSLPSVHGLADDRVKISVNGMNITSACSNHMNPALSYAAPSNVGKAQVMAGITPVSQGGDSIGGTISVDPLAPEFAASADTPLHSGSVGGFMRSVNGNIGNNLSGRYANQDLSFDFNGSWSKANNYRSGNDGPSVAPSSFLTTNLYLRGAAKLDRGFVAADVNLQHIPYQGFPNQRMDVAENNGVLGGISLEKDFDWGKLNARVYHHQTWHKMDTLDERRTAPMPMKADGSDTGYRVRAEIPWRDVHTFRIGNEFFRQTLHDWWPGITQSQVQDFISVNNGERNRIGTFAEWQADWNDKWTTQVGLRNDMVWMDSGQVHGYYATQDDLTARLWEPGFNAADRARVDANFDATLQASYTPNDWSQYELGLARKTRSPNLYERYAWYGHNTMVTWFGDGNAYAGNLDLKPEIAYNFSLTGAWHDADEKIWSLQVSPYYTHITDYIWGQTEAVGSSGFRGMHFVNLPYADLYGADASARYAFAPESDSGRWALRGKLAYVRGVGENGLTGRPCPYAAIGLDAICNAKGWPTAGLQSPQKVNLYHMMPLHGSITLEHGLEGAWGKLNSELGVDLVDRKTTVATTYGEPQTPGYVLLNLHSSYRFKQIKLDFGVDNLLDKRYYNPLGGIDIAATYAQGFPIPGLLPVLAMGRSAYLSVNFEF